MTTTHWQKTEDSARAKRGLYLDPKNSIDGIRQKVCKNSRGGTCGLLKVDSRLQPGQPMPLGFFNLSCTRTDRFKNECIYCDARTPADRRDRMAESIVEALDELYGTEGVTS